MIRDSSYPFETVIILYPCHLHCLDMLHFFQRLNKQNSIQRFDVIVFDFMSRHFQQFFFVLSSHLFTTCRFIYSVHLRHKVGEFVRKKPSQLSSKSIALNSLLPNERTNIDAMSIEIHFLERK